MATVRVEREEETPRGWTYHLVTPGGTRHVLTLSFVDYEHWAGGRVPPSMVAEALASYVAAERPEGLPGRFDASTARRWLPGLDAHLRGATSARW